MFIYDPCRKCIVRIMCSKECDRHRRNVNIHVKVVDTVVNMMVVIAAAVIIFQIDGWFK